MSATVYSFLAADGSYLYIGCSENLRHRIGNHRAKPWWADATEMRILAGPTALRGAKAIERHLIELHDPPHNIEWTAAWRAPRLAAGEAVGPRPLTEMDALILEQGWTALPPVKADVEAFWQRIRLTPPRVHRRSA